MMKQLFMALLLLALPTVQAAKVDTYQFDDPAQEQSYKKCKKPLNLCIQAILF